MKRATFSCLVAVCLGLSTARPAHADIGALMDYIGGLSGPGPFFPGIVFTLDVVCLEAERGDATDEALRNGRPVPFVSNLGCTGDLRLPRQSYEFLTGWYHSDHRLPDTYFSSPEKQLLSPGITGITVALTFKTTIPFVTNQSWLRSVDIGATAGAIVFKSTEPRFETFAVPLLELPRVVVRPLAPIACLRNDKVCPSGWTKWDLVELTVGTRIIGGVTSEDFGAAPGVRSGLHIMKLISGGVSYKF